MSIITRALLQTGRINVFSMASLLPRYKPNRKHMRCDCQELLNYLQVYTFIEGIGWRFDDLSYFMKTNIPLKRIHVSYMECIDIFAILFFALICLKNDVCDFRFFKFSTQTSIF